ncbi:hypothetical protein [Winogradskyella wichelsiae]|uniref:hypothetical protein n=1 Tax=Winogradskyella wichelsiae TaxID=2697007 RepID=UPI0015CA3162|nr:hypothetical protein [Winogradskyella wichelsiae]
MKNLSKLGKALSKVEQKEIIGGKRTTRIGQCYTNADCCIFQNNQSYGYVCYAPTGDRGNCVPGIFDPFNNPCGN